MGFIFLQKSKIELIHFRKSLFFMYAFFQEMLNVSSEHSLKYNNWNITLGLTV